MFLCVKVFFSVCFSVLKSPFQCVSVCYGIFFSLFQCVKVSFSVCYSVLQSPFQWCPICVPHFSVAPVCVVSSFQELLPLPVFVFCWCVVNSCLHGSVTSCDAPTHPHPPPPPEANVQHFSTGVYSDLKFLSPSGPILDPLLSICCPYTFLPRTNLRTL